MQTRCIVKTEAQKIHLSRGVGSQGARLFLRHPVCLMKSQFYTNTPCTSTTLYSIPGSHTGRIVPLLAGVRIHVLMCVLPWVIVRAETRIAYTNHQSEISGQSHEKVDSLFLSISRSIYLFLSLSLCISLYLSLSLYLFLSSLFLCLCLSLSLSLSLCLCLSKKKRIHHHRGLAPFFGTEQTKLYLVRGRTRENVYHKSGKTGIHHRGLRP